MKTPRPTTCGFTRRNFLGAASAALLRSHADAEVAAESANVN